VRSQDKFWDGEAGRLPSRTLLQNRRKGQGRNRHRSSKTVQNFKQREVTRPWFPRAKQPGAGRVLSLIRAIGEPRISAKAAALFGATRIWPACSTPCRAWKSRAACLPFRANASGFHSRWTRPRRPAGLPGGSASSVLRAWPPRCPRAADRPNAARFSAG